MIYLIHGENQVDSRRFLIKLKDNYRDIQNISGKNLNSQYFKQKLVEASKPLFGGNSAFLIENFDGNWEIFPEKLPETLDLILWSNQKLMTSQAPVLKNFLFDKAIKPSAFKLSDSILFKDEKDAQIVLSKLLSAKEPTEKIIGALLRGLFLVYCAKESLEELQIPSFAKEKLKEQAKNWSKSQIRNVILQLLKMDLMLKEGKKTQIVFSNFISQVISS